MIRATRFSPCRLPCAFSSSYIRGLPYVRRLVEEHPNLDVLAQRLLEPLGYLPPATFEQNFPDSQNTHIPQAVLTYRARRQTRGGSLFDVTYGNIQELGRSLVGRKMTARLNDQPELTVQALDRVGGRQDLADAGG